MTISDEATAKPGEVTLTIGGDTIVFAPGNKVDVYVRCRCRRGVRIRFALSDDGKETSAGTLHQGEECGWYKRTSPEQFIADRGGDIVRGGPQ